MSGKDLLEKIEEIRQEWHYDYSIPESRNVALARVFETVADVLSKIKSQLDDIRGWIESYEEVVEDCGLEDLGLGVKNAVKEAIQSAIRAHERKKH